MKNKQLLFKILLTLLIVKHGRAQVPISPVYFGQNYFFSDPTNASPVLMDANLQPLVKESGVAFMRYGGIGVATGFNGTSFIRLPDQMDYQRVITDIRTNFNAEPLIQVPFKPNFISVYNQADAGDIAYWARYAAKTVDYINNVLKMNVKYWQIANEPNNSTTSKKGYGYSSGSNSNTTDAGYIAVYFTVRTLR